MLSRCATTTSWSGTVTVGVLALGSVASSLAANDGMECFAAMPEQTAVDKPWVGIGIVRLNGVEGEGLGLGLGLDEDDP